MSNIDIIGVSPRKITLAYKNPDEFNGELKLGTYIKIPDQETGAKEILGMISNYHIQYIEKKDEEGNDISMKRFVIDVDILGTIEEDLFIRGGHGITIPPHNDVAIASTDDLKKIYIIDDIKKFSFSNLSQDNGVRVNIDGNKFFNKHFAIVGSTGSGKSNTVAKILQTGIEEKNGGFDLNNSHIVLFDIHGEYQDCFGDKANKINIDNLKLPYRLLNSGELEDIFIDTKETNAHNQISQFVRGVTLNKQMHNTTLNNIHFNSPVLFNINEVFNYIKNLNLSTKDANTGELKIDNIDTSKTIEENLFRDDIVFTQKKTGQVNTGHFAGEFDRFIIRLENKLKDNRLNFMLGDDARGISFQDAIKQFIGYTTNQNITVIDLSGIPSEVLNIVVSLISRLLFQYGYYHKKYLKTQLKEIEIPLVLVFEEAHKYIPKTGGSKYNSARESIERIAKEGRKYGVTLGIISQRPSEISETIFSQCNNFIAMRLTNPDDQNYVKRLLPDALGDMIEILPLLERGEGLIMGDSINMPSLIKIDECDIKPHSNDVKYIELWKEEWKEIDFEQLEATWKG